MFLLNSPSSLILNTYCEGSKAYSPDFKKKKKKIEVNHYFSVLTFPIVRFSLSFSFLKIFFFLILPNFKNVALDFDFCFYCGHMII